MRQNRFGRRQVRRRHHNILSRRLLYFVFYSGVQIGLVSISGADQSFGRSFDDFHDGTLGNNASSSMEDDAILRSFRRLDDEFSRSVFYSGGFGRGAIAGGLDIETEESPGYDHLAGAVMRPPEEVEAMVAKHDSPELKDRLSEVEKELQRLRNVVNAGGKVTFQERQKMLAEQQSEYLSSGAGEEKETHFTKQLREVDRATDPTFFVDRKKLFLVEKPTVEFGLWHAILATYQVLNRYVALRFFDSHSGPVPDRLLAKRLKKFLLHGCPLEPKTVDVGGGSFGKSRSALRSLSGLAGGEDMGANIFVDDEPAFLVFGDAKLLAWAMLLALPVKPLFYSDLSASSGSVEFIDPKNANQLQNWDPFSYSWHALTPQHRTLRRFGTTARSRWGSYSLLEDFGFHLGQLDRVDPFDPNWARIKTLFVPVSGFKGSTKSQADEPTLLVRPWQISPRLAAGPGATSKILDIIAHCVALQPSF